MAMKIIAILREQRAKLRAEREAGQQAWDQRAHTRIAEAFHQQEMKRRGEQEAQQQAERAAQEALASSRFKERRYGPSPFRPITEEQFRQVEGSIIDTDELGGGRRLHLAARDGRLIEVLEHPEGVDQ